MHQGGNQNDDRNELLPILFHSLSRFSLDAEFPEYLRAALPYLNTRRHVLTSLIIANCDLFDTVVWLYYLPNVKSVLCLQAEHNTNRTAQTPDSYYSIVHFNTILNEKEGATEPSKADLIIYNNGASTDEDVTIDIIKVLLPRVSVGGLFVMDISATSAKTLRIANDAQATAWNGHQVYPYLKDITEVIVSPPSLILSKRSSVSPSLLCDYHNESVNNDGSEMLKEANMPIQQHQVSEFGVLEDTDYDAPVGPVYCSTDPNEKFMSYHANYGRFNNQRRYMYTAMAMALALNRTLMFPPFTMVNTQTYAIGSGSIHDYFNVPLLTSRVRICDTGFFPPNQTVNYFQHEIDPQNTDQFTPAWYNNETILQQHGDMSARMVMFYWVIDAWDFGNMKNSGLSASLMENDELLMNVSRKLLKAKIWPHNIFSVESWETLETDEYLWLRSAVRPKSAIMAKAEKFVQQTLGAAAFLGVHVRIEPVSGWKGQCPVCCYSDDVTYYAARIKTALDKYQVSTVFLAIQPELLEEYADKLEEQGIAVMTAALSYRDSNKQSLYEQSILLQATGFIGSLCSTFSAAIWEERMVSGKPQDSNEWW